MKNDVNASKEISVAGGGITGLMLFWIAFSRHQASMVMSAPSERVVCIISSSSSSFLFVGSNLVAHTGDANGVLHAWLKWSMFHSISLVAMSCWSSV